MNKPRQSLRRSAAPRKRPPTSNYYRSGSKSTETQASPFQKRTKVISRIRKVLTRALDIILATALLLGLIYSLIVNPTPTIQINDTFYHSLDNYRDSAHSHLSGFRDRSKISFNEQAVVNAMQSDYPEIDNLSIELPVFSQHPVIHIKIAAASFVLANSDHQYVIDANGKAIGLTSNFRKAASLPKISDQSGYPIVPGKAVLSSSDVSFIKSLIAESAKSGIKFESLVLPTTPAELDAKPLGKNYIVKFYLPGDARMQIGQFLAAAHQFDSGGEQPTQYLDVRVSGKIFYK